MALAFPERNLDAALGKEWGGRAWGAGSVLIGDDRFRQGPVVE